MEVLANLIPFCSSLNYPHLKGLTEEMEKKAMYSTHSLCKERVSKIPMVQKEKLSVAAKRNS